jgi:hypothetical protein
VDFLKSEYSCNKDKLFGNVIDLKKLLQELRADDSIANRIKKPKPENIKSCFLLYNNVPKFELFEPVKDNDFELIGKFKKSLYENSEEAFLDELIFCKMDNLYTIEDFLATKIFEVIHNIYTDKNAYDLMLEECSKKNSEQKNKRVKNKKPKKKRSNSKRDDSSNETTPAEDVKRQNPTAANDNGNMSWRKKPVASSNNKIIV